MNFFKSKKVNERLTAIYSLTGEILYLIEGDERAVLIDTSVGIKGLRDLVKGMTDKPLFVLLTHGHVDHAPGAVEFNDVYLNFKDLPLYKRHCDIGVRTGYLQAGLDENQFDQLMAQNALLAANPNFEFHDLQDGQIFDLGGLHLACYNLPGHTQGSMVILIRELKILIMGDSCNKSTFLFDSDSVSVEEYRENLTRLLTRLTGSYQRVFISHHVMEVDAHIIENVLSVCDDVMAGKADDVPFEFMDQHAWIAKKVLAEFNRADGIDGNIIYSKERIRKDQLAN